MESKEFIQDEIKKIENILKEHKNVFSKEMKSLCEDDLKHYNQVLKDLEVLEILKEANRYGIWELNVCFYFIQDGSDGYKKMEITKEQYDLINQYLEEWLNNDK